MRPLNQREEILVETLRQLPAAATERMIVWAAQLRQLADGRNVEWDDSWSNEDMSDLTSASLAEFSRREQGAD